jgi:hypothetical protein
MRISTLRQAMIFASFISALQFYAVFVLSKHIPRAPE